LGRLLTYCHLFNPQIPIFRSETKISLLSFIWDRPYLSILKPFGCLCFISTLSRNRDKLGPRALPGIFLGYPFGKKGYKVLLLQNNQISISRNIKFVEDVFPFSFSSPLSKLFPQWFSTSDADDALFFKKQSHVSNDNNSLLSTPHSPLAPDSLPFESPVIPPVISSEQSTLLRTSQRVP